jgi:adenylate kinase family enzyme
MNKESSFPYRRIIVVGTTGSGKSTLGQQLANKLGLDFIELDALNWGPNWTPAGEDLLRARVEVATRAPAWVVAGNYSATHPVTWPRADAVIWLDYPLRVIFWQLLTRTLRRAWTREQLWGGNRERLGTQLKLWSDESLFHWLFKTYWRRKREFPQLFAMGEHAHLYILQLKSPGEAQAWLANL